MRVVAALGGNALLRRGEPFDIERQRHNAAVAARAIAPLVGEHELVITHGNGPQIGFLARGAAAVSPAQQDLDALGAESGGLVGYLLEQALVNELPQCAFATLLTQTIVHPDDPAFSTPTKPVGPWVNRAEADRLAAEFHWRFEGEGPQQRRVVASPRPLDILQLRAVEALLDAKIVPICMGGGGVPVFFDRDGLLHGAEAVVDKDLASALLARTIRADKLLLLTDVDAVYDDWGGEHPRPLARVIPADLEEIEFEAGSMGPKVAAACEFVETGGTAAIGALGDAPQILRGERGTQIAAPASG